MVFYESHSLIHGRPFPLQGRFYANCFVHFEPVEGHGFESTNENYLPPYIIPDSPEAIYWMSENEVAWSKELGVYDIMEILDASARGDLDQVRDMVAEEPTVVNAMDDYGSQVRALTIVLCLES